MAKTRTLRGDAAPGPGAEHVPGGTAAPPAIEISTRPASPGILGVGRALPAWRYPQQALLEHLHPGAPEAAARIFERAGVGDRALCIAPDQFGRTADPEFQFRLLTEGTTELGARAATEALAAAATPADAIGCVIGCTSSGFRMPSLSTVLRGRLSLPPDAARYDLVGAGCGGAVSTLALALDHLAAHPGERVLAVCAEVGSVYLRQGATDKEAMVVNALFADAAVALVLGAGAGASGGARWPCVLATAFQQDEGLDSATVAVHGAQGSTAHLHKELPERSARLFELAIHRFLDRQGLHPDAIRHWVFHPGGRAVLDALQLRLGLDDAQLSPSREALRAHGNASSPTCLLALDRLARSATPPAPGDLGILGAIGPGLVAGLALLIWPE